MDGWLQLPSQLGLLDEIDRDVTQNQDAGGTCIGL